MLFVDCTEWCEKHGQDHSSELEKAVLECGR